MLAIRISGAVIRTAESKALRADSKIRPPHFAGQLVMHDQVQRISASRKLSCRQLLTEQKQSRRDLVHVWRECSRSDRFSVAAQLDVRGDCFGAGSGSNDREVPDRLAGAK